MKPMIRYMGNDEDTLRKAPSFFVKPDGSRMVRATQNVSFPGDGALTKYDALFDLRPCFDALRMGFITEDDPQMKVHTFLQHAQHLFEDQETIAGEDVAHVDALLESLRRLKALQTEPPPHHDDVCRRAWPAYVRALTHKDYYLDVQEVVLLCILAQRSVVTSGFECKGDELRLEVGDRDAGLTW